MAKAAQVILLSTALILLACGRPGADSTTPVQGTLQGDVLAGPTCPVEDATHPCPPAPIAARKVFIAQQKQRVMTVVTNEQGRFSAHLPAGQYQVEVELVGIEIAKEQPLSVMVEPRQTTVIRIMVDTGIR
jgi:hypothetical protein